ncbi:uncharacterized protein KGF55_000890 [Candida pseudojiufengensis]|uniref:uncharacterized protein n=1 Tax=Candida pseudojiufengensis TaxID=497109 RepID=UPI002225556A|nr:uncharacterized protein KGF55_000890 [Candida pseudojiufengensis]KAI5966580.1 hypothetical protein KGF55_000890 [Candida pseudojiufengensis]
MQSRFDTFQYEDDLPTLPVPSLVSTVQQLLASLKPLTTSEEYEQLLDEANSFLQNETIQLIQKHLEHISKKNKNNNYLNIVNNNMTPAIYGELKADILPKNPYLILEEDPYSKTINPPNQSERSANLVNSTLKFIVTLRNKTLKPDLTPKNQVPLTMTCYNNLFGTTRAPDVEGGTFDISMKKYKNINDSRHIIIIANNQFYSLEVLSEDKGDSNSKHEILFHDHELAAIFQKIIDDSDVVDPVESINNCIGSITTQSLKHWKLGREELEKSNPHQLKLIDDALFVLILDSNSPKTDQEKTSIVSHGTSVLSKHNVQIGTCTSRWYDKLQLIVTRNSVAGVVWESITMDSTAILRFISDIYTDSVLKLAKNINGSEYTLFDDNVTYSTSNENKPEPYLIPFNMTNELQHIIHLAETKLADLLNQHEYKTHTIKLDSRLAGKFGLSIDSILQICFQVANYSLYGRMVNTLEPIMTRKFKEARTELIPVQNDSIAQLCKLYITNASRQEKFEAFNECCKIHSKQYHDAMIGKGFERHFMSIVQVVNRPVTAKRLNEMNPDLPPIPDFGESLELEIPLLFNSNVDNLSNPELLISNCGNPALRLFGIPPAVDQGFGIGYIIHHDKIIITVCSKHRQTDRFIDTFHRIAADLKTSLKMNSNFLLSISESESRKIEIQKLRIENELSSLSLDSPILKHPIPLTTDKDDPIETNGFNGYHNGRKTSSSSENDDDSSDFELLGGYGYFDYGDLDTRSDKLARNHSNFSSQPQSALSSAYSSRHHSSTNLNKLPPMSTAYDLKQKLSISESIRDKLSKSEDTISPIDSTPEPTDEKKTNPKNSIGKPLDLSHYG